VIRDINKTTELHPPFGEMIRALLGIADYEGLRVGIFMAYRSFEEQSNLYYTGRDITGKVIGKIITNAGPGRSWHNYGFAADIVLLDEGGDWRWDYKNEFDKWEKLGRIGKLLGLTWGGDFRPVYGDPEDPHPDYPHFQRTFGLKMKEALTLYKRFGLRGVWDAVKL